MKTIYRGKTNKGVGIVVRYPVEKDLDQLRCYINILSKEQTYIRFQGEQLTMREESKYLNDQLKKIDKREEVKLLVFNNNKLMAVADINLKDKIESHVGVFGITVAKEFRNQGIGKLLMNLVFKEAQKKIPSLKIVTLGVFANNPIAKEMYKKFGFVEYGKLPKGLVHKNQFIDHVFMFKKL